MRDLHDLWPHKWLSNKANVFNSPIDGLGLVANKNIPQGEEVMIYGGVIVPKKNIKNYRKLVGHAGIQIADNYFICPTSRQEIEKTGILNHSCEPNSGFRDLLTVVTMREIKKGEEILIDYAFCESYFDSFKCKCGSQKCRGVITSDDWKSVKLQQNYKSYFSPYLEEKF